MAINRSIRFSHEIWYSTGSDKGVIDGLDLPIHLR